MDWWARLTGQRSSNSAQLASERLQLVLKYDRAKLPPGLIDTLKDELLEVISRYVEVAEDGIQVSLSSPSRGTQAQVELVANVPIRGPRRTVGARR
ncbi:MAG: cell division topological specificity factor MinE [Limnochordaceae bacterium]|uniref:Cell division topological specificity factor n=1 Tax=Carboxydichorda subterranea TaxID=3109565 RepID=A0ABZ1BZJ3_9FIRM|nr:cell division topological specificity factor MinE [Limnochorda sp. L945t]MBE3598254.1 cell division topological specificity factor MinE [Limnochordaceae bacterium]WRP18222.1 cell division topological specificity factor MinE [Limnochorda sp. L945t]